MAKLGRWYMGYLAVAFIALIPVASYRLIRDGLKSVLFFVVPAYFVLALSYYQWFRNSKPK